MANEKKIFVHAGFMTDNPLIGTIYVSQAKGNETYSFEYDTGWLQKSKLLLDPDLYLYRGRQYVSGKSIFGAFADSCPDRWGRLLMNRREALRAESAGEKPSKLLESDYLLGVFDESRMGGLRFKLEADGEFESNDAAFATPPWTSLRELEQASIAFEGDEREEEAKWIRQLIAPGSSLGGARPKASVIAPDGSLWIAKFPSRHDEFDSGAWEKVVHDLAEKCELKVPEAKAEKFSKNGTTFLTKRFDRDGNERIHFSSAMTMLGKTDGSGSSDGSGYLDMVSFIRANGASPEADLKELWKRIVFSMAVSNTDDHFRNHGFILSDKGWVLSPMYDVNPDIYGRYLSLNVGGNDSRMDYHLAENTAEYYGIGKEEAEALIEDISNTVIANWQPLAKAQGIGRTEIEKMKPAFETLQL